MNDVTLELEVIQAVGQAVGRLSDPDAQRRVLRWINDRFQPATASYVAAGATTDTIDSQLGVDGLAEFFDSPGAKPTSHQDGAKPGEGGLEKLVSGFVADFQKCVLDWEGA